MPSGRQCRPSSSGISSLFFHVPLFTWRRVPMVTRGDASTGNGGQRRQGWCHRGVGTGPCRVRGRVAPGFAVGSPHGSPLRDRLVPLGLRHRRRVRRRRALGDPRPRSACPRDRPHPRDRARSTCGPDRSRSPAASATSRPASCSPSSIPASPPPGVRSPSRWPAARACSSVPTTGCSLRRWRWRAVPNALSS